jgi:hypothetical protein
MELAPNWVGSCHTPKYNTRLENFARDKYSSLFGLVVSDKEIVL